MGRYQAPRAYTAVARRRGHCGRCASTMSGALAIPAHFLGPMLRREEGAVAENKLVHLTQMRAGADTRTGIARTNPSADIGPRM
eukprot:scaffold234166_cov31-Tisochrysis_lutea.AAC.2